MDKLAAYMADLADLLGVENIPVFVGVKNASTGLLAKVPDKYRQDVWKRIQTGKSKPDSRPGRALSRIEDRLGSDALGSAELRDSTDKVIYLFKAVKPMDESSITIRQQGQVDGTVTGLIGADDTMHLHLRDVLSRNLTLVVKDEILARQLLEHFRRGQIRVRVDGVWARTSEGWIPVTNKCVVEGFDVLDETPVERIFAGWSNIKGNGWRELDDPMAAWRDLRGIH